MTASTASNAPDGVNAIPVTGARRSYWRRQLLGLLLFVGDLTTLAFASWLFDQWNLLTLLFGVVLVIAYAQRLLYRNRITMSVLDDLPKLSSRYLVAAGLTLLVAIAVGMLDGDRRTILAWGLTFVMLIAWRTVAYAAIRWLRSRRVIGKRTIVVGCGNVGTSLAYALQREKSCGLEPIGFIDSLPADVTYELPLPLLGPVEQMPELIEEYQADYVLVAFTHVRESVLVPIIRRADKLPASIAVVPRLYELVAVRGAMDAVSDIPLMSLHRPAFRSPLWPVKRLVDIVASLGAIVVLSPLLAALALTDRIVDGPGVIFRQERIGVDGQTFQLLKFRSLRPVDDSESATKWNIKHDDRVSWFGKFLRRSSLDELPQLFNILKGDMSIVGPRPERPHFAEQFGKMYPWYGSRHRVPCGLTGWAQIHGLRGDTSIAGRARYDNFYIENWSLWLDAKIVLRTISSLTRGSG